MTTGIEAQVLQPYKYGFVTDIEADVVPPGLSADVIRLISAKKGEPEWMLEWRLRAYRNWLKMPEPHWANVRYGPIDYQAISYYAAPKAKPKLESLAQVDPKLVETFAKLGIPIEEQKRLAGVAVDAVFDSVSVATTFRETLARQGIIFCAISEAIREHPELVRAYLGSVVPYNDNFFAALNSAVFTDGSFAYIPKGVRCPLELSTYFRINTSSTGQFERTLIVAEEGSSVSYLEGCSAPIRDEHQLHAAVVELVALDNATIKYSTIQNWYPGDEAGRGGIYNFVTKRGKCLGKNSKISWTQVETGSAITWKYPGCILQGDNSIGEFYSVAVTNNRQQADTGTKMIHLGKNTRSTIVSKGISAGHGQNTYRGLVKILKGAEGARNYSQCDSMLIGDQCGAHTFPYIDVRNSMAIMEHEASTSKIGEDQIFYCKQRGLAAEDAVNMIVNGFCKEVFKELPMEFAVDGNEILRGVDLTVRAGEVHAIMGPNGSGKSTLAQVLAGNPAYTITTGSAQYLGKDLVALKPEERAREGLFLAFQYPVAIRGITNAYFLRSALNAIRKSRGQEELGPVEFMDALEEKLKVIGWDDSYLSRPVNDGFSGGEKKRNEILQLAVLEPKLAILDETDSGLDIDALKTVAHTVDKLRRPDSATVLVTHYYRILTHIMPDYVHVLSGGRIVKSGGKDLALELEEKGYDWVRDEAPVA